MRQVRQRQRLQPDAARPGKSGKEDAVTAKKHVANTLDARDLKTNTRLEHADVSGVDSHGFFRPQIVGHDLAVELDPCLACTSQPLQQKAVTAKNAGAERLLKSHAEVDSGRRTQKPMTMDHVSLPGSNLDRQNMAGYPRSERQDASCTLCGILG